MDVEFDKEIEIKKESDDENEKELERLERFVFGDPSDAFKDLDESIGKRKRRRKHKAVVETANQSSDDEQKDIKIKQRKPAWQDEEDVKINITEAHAKQGRPNIDHPLQKTDSYCSLLRRRFENVVGNPTWAELDKEEIKSEDEDDLEMLRRCGKFVSKKSGLLSNEIQYKSVRDLNWSTRREGKVINAVEFNPQLNVALVAGMSGVASLFEVDGKDNTKMETIKFKRFPIMCAKFTHEGKQFIVGSEKSRGFYTYDMVEGRSVFVPIHNKSCITDMMNFEVSSVNKVIAVCGESGNIVLLSETTKELLGKLKMNEHVQGITFSSDGSRLYSNGDSGKVYVWDVKSRRCLHIFNDEGCLKGTSICVSPDDNLLACGSSSGIVNLYEPSAVLKSTDPVPIKAIGNLTTAISSLKFNHTSQLLAIASVENHGALRLMHYPSLTVYPKFPPYSNKNFGNVHCLNFSPNSGYLAYGTNTSVAKMFRLFHFEKY